LSPPTPSGLTSQLIIDDKTLMKWFIEHYSEFNYLNFTLNGRQPPQLISLKKSIEKLDYNDKLHLQKKVLLDVWKNLMGLAIVYLKSNDKREKYNDDEDYGVEKLSDFFKTFSEFETVFYGADQYYRDHVTHMFKVYLLGEYLIRHAKIYETIEINPKNALDPDFKILDCEKEAMWCIISLTHDVGYGLGMIKKINKKTRIMLDQIGINNIQDISFSFTRQPIYDFILKFVSSDLTEITDKTLSAEEIKKRYTQDEIDKGKSREFVNHIQSKYFLKFAGSYERFGHGILSCILLMRNLVYFLESDYTIDSNRPLNQQDAHHFLIRQTILRSIASHDCDDIYYLKVLDFPFLLTLIDEMQDWERPGLSDLFEKKPNKTLYVNKLDEKNVEFNIEFTKPTPDTLKPEEVIEIRCSILKEFENKCKKIRKILRSAVDGEARDFVLKFGITDKVGDTVNNYEITHTYPNDIKLKINNAEMTWIQFTDAAKKTKSDFKKSN
jgi:hypothetical protein